MDLSMILQYARNMTNLTRHGIVRERRLLFNLMNGDVFYGTKVWPLWIKKLFWKKPLSDMETFKVFLSFIGNGCPPTVIVKWILTSVYWKIDDKTLDKRARQLRFLLDNIKRKESTWFYYDLHNERVLFLDGSERVGVRKSTENQVKRKRSIGIEAGDTRYECKDAWTQH